MNEEKIMGKLSGIKGIVQKLMHKNKPIHFDKSEIEMRFDDNGLDNYVDDLPLTLNREEGPGVEFYSTENSEFANGAPKSDAHGIDSFGEKDTFSFEEADDFQTNRDRRQNSDLSQRFYTGGMPVIDLNK
jgi:hypothetical protein